MAAKLGMFSVTNASVPVPVGRGRKMRTALRTKETARFVTVPSKKKKETYVIHQFSRWYSGGTQDPIFPIRTDLDW